MRNTDFKDMGICVHDEFCGGCLYQGVSYDEQLKTKEAEVLAHFRDKEVSPGFFDGIEGCPEGFRYRYRNKMEYTFGDLVKDGPLCLGMHKIRNFMSIVTVDSCQLVDEDFNMILRYTLDFAAERGYRHYHRLPSLPQAQSHGSSSQSHREKGNADGRTSHKSGDRNC